jgi:hypothetical protein
VVITIVDHWMIMRMERNRRRCVLIEYRMNNVDRHSNVTVETVYRLKGSRLVKTEGLIKNNVISIMNVNLIIVEDINLHHLYRKSNCY